MNSPSSGLNILHASSKCWLRESDLYCVSTYVLRKPELRQFDKAKSIIRYLPPNGTAGLLLKAVRGYNLSPCPPAKSIVTVSLRIDEPGKTTISPFLDL